MKKSILLATGMAILAGAVPAQAGSSDSASVQVVVRNRTKSYLMNPSGLFQAKTESKGVAISFPQGVVPGDTQIVETMAPAGSYQIFFTPQSQPTLRDKVISCTGVFRVPSSESAHKQVMITVYEQRLSETDANVTCRVEQQLALAS